jgi:hypothetical protein
VGGDRLGGFAQTRLVGEHGLLRGSPLAAIPFALIHLPLAFEERGLTRHRMEWVAVIPPSTAISAPPGPTWRSPGRC